MNISHAFSEPSRRHQSITTRSITYVPTISSQPSDVVAGLVSRGNLGPMRTVERLRYSVYVVLLDEYVGTLPQMRGRNPKRDPSKPCVYVGLIPLRVGCRFDFRGATPKYEWRTHRFGLGLMPELHEHLNPTTLERALQTARKLADDLRAKGFGVANGTCTDSQLYKSIVPQAKER
jgi:hypothetical protein